MQNFHIGKHQIARGSYVIVVNLYKLHAVHFAVHKS